MKGGPSILVRVTFRTSIMDYSIRARGPGRMLPKQKVEAMLSDGWTTLEIIFIVLLEKLELK